MAPFALSQSEYQAIGSTRCRMRQLWSPTETEARRVGIPAPQHEALLVIAGRASPAHISLRELTECLALRPHTVEQLVSRLAEANLVSRDTRHNGRSQVLLALTPTANAHLERLAAEHRRELDGLSIVLSELLTLVSNRAN